MKRHHTHRGKPTTPTLFVFSPRSLELLQQAMHLFAQAAARSSSQTTTLAFAKETMLAVNAKLEQMRASVGHACLTTFDYNEKVVIATAIQQYMVQFLFLSQPLTVAQQRELRICEQVTWFALAGTIIPKKENQV